MKHLLIPTDFSANAWNATEYALAFFEHHPIKIYLLHITFSGVVEDNTDLHAHGITISAQESHPKYSALDELKQRIETLYPSRNLEIEILVKHSFFVDSIKKTVQEKEIDLIVMGTKGASGLKEVTIGSHSGAVITRVKCPILVIPENARFENPKNIVFPTDFNTPYKDRVLQTLFSVADMYEATIKVMRVAPEAYELDEAQEENRNFLMQSLAGKPHSFHWINSPGLEEGLQNFIDVMEVQIIAMVAKNLNFFQRLLFKPTVERIGYHTKIPFLVLHE